MTLQNLGQEIDEFPVSLNWARVVEHFDGDRLVEYRSAGNDPYFKIWLDTDGDLTRWMVLRLTDRDVATFLHMDRSLRDLILSARDGHVYLVDKRGSETQRVAFLRIRNIPHDVLPDDDSFYDETLTPDCSGAASSEQLILLEGQWDADKLAKLERRYGQVYAFNALFGFGSQKNIDWIENRLSNYVFAGSGWSHVNAVDQVVAFVPKEDKPRFEGIQLQSPGVVRYSVDGATAAKARAVLRTFRESSEQLARKYDVLWGRLNEVNRVVRDSYMTTEEAARFLAEPNEPIRAAARTLAESLGLDADRVWSVGGVDINSAELIAAYYRRVQELHQSEEDGRVTVV